MHRVFSRRQSVLQIGFLTTMMRLHALRKSWQHHSVVVCKVHCQQRKEGSECGRCIIRCVPQMTTLVRGVHFYKGVVLLRCLWSSTSMLGITCSNSRSSCTIHYMYRWKGTDHSTLTYEEKNAIRYAAGYVPRSLKKKFEVSPPFKGRHSTLYSRPAWWWWWRWEWIKGLGAWAL